jgi:nicotinamidase-related amidase
MASSTTTIRVRQETRAALAELAEQEGRTIIEVVARLVDAARANAMFDHHIAITTGLGEPPAIPAAFEAEQSVLDGTLLDGLEHDEWPRDEHGQPLR